MELATIPNERAALLHGRDRSSSDDRKNYGATDLDASSSSQRSQGSAPDIAIDVHEPQDAPQPQLVVHHVNLSQDDLQILHDLLHAPQQPPQPHAPQRRRIHWALQVLIAFGLGINAGRLTRLMSL